MTLTPSAYIPISSALEVERTAGFINDELYSDGGFFAKAWDMVDLNNDG